MAMPPDIALRTEAAEDETVLYRLLSELDTFEQRSPSSPAPMTLEAFRQRRAARDDTGTADFTITVDGTVVGRVNLFNEDCLARHAEVGIALLPEARGKGIGTAALAQLVEFAFVRRNLRRLHLVVIASNAAAIASYRKIGFVDEGLRREHCWVRGRYEDEVIMGLLRSDWLAARGPLVRDLGGP
jgi:RimJ/RimL family protein N-acetyltransferase